MPASAVIPVLTYSDVRAAVEWHGATFGFREQLRIADHRAQLGIGADSVVFAQGSVDTATAGWPTHSIMVRVVDVDAHHDRAVVCGARVTIPLTTYPFGERQYTAVDIGGHVWTFSQTVADIDPATWEGVTVTYASHA
jgi:uncharacterized glyoxalase superfamily protein PhnB